MSDLRQAVDDYVKLRRAVGFKLRGHDRLLLDFVDYVEQAGTSTVTTRLAVAWATQPASVHPGRWKQRLCVVRGFTRYMNASDSSTEVPPADLLAFRRERPTPFLFSESEVVELLAATDILRPLLHAATYRTLFGLLGATGMRVGEAIGLDRADVDLQVGVLTIWRSKFNKSRRLPLQPSTLAALKSYAQERDRLARGPKAPSFFVSTRGTRLLDVCVHGVFRQLVNHIGLQPRSWSRAPRIHDLRHSFAVTTLRDWCYG